MNQNLQWESRKFGSELGDLKSFQRKAIFQSKIMKTKYVFK